MNAFRSKILTLISSVLLFASLILCFLLLFTQAINNGVFKPEGGDISISIGIGCSTAAVIIMLIFAVIAQVFAMLFTIVSFFPVKRKSLAFTSGTFSIVFCVLAGFMYIIAFISFYELQNGSSSAQFVSATLIYSAISDCIAIVLSVISMILKGKVKVVKGMKQEDLPKPFVVDNNADKQENNVENVDGENKN